MSRCPQRQRNPVAANRATAQVCWCIQSRIILHRGDSDITKRISTKRCFGYTNMNQSGFLRFFWRRLNLWPDHTFQTRHVDCRIRGKWWASDVRNGMILLCAVDRCFSQFMHGSRHMHSSIWIDALNLKQWSNETAFCCYSQFTDGNESPIGRIWVWNVYYFRVRIKQLPSEKQVQPRQ